MAGDEIAYVAVAPRSTLDADLIKKVAAIIDKEHYDTRLLLSGEIPRIIAHCHSMDEADSIARGLRELGLVAIVCRDSELREPLESFNAHTMEFREGEVLFQDKGGRERRMGSSDVFLMLKGKIQTYIEEETTKSRMKISWPATLLTGGIPIWRKVGEKTRETSVQSEYFIRLYGRKPSEPSVEILQSNMNYSFMGASMTFSSLTNFGAVVTKLREVFPQAVFDDMLVKSFGPAMTSISVQADLEIKLRLLYKYYLATSGL
jgi:hypothetical protein